MLNNYNDKNSKIAQHIEQYDHNMDFKNAEIVSIERKIIAHDCSLRLGIPKWTKVLAMTILTFQTFIGL